MLIVVRHGNTFGPGDRVVRVGARTDLPLTAEGRRQAERLGVHLAGRGVVPDRILAGPLRRTRETAAILAEVLGGVAGMDDRLRELDYGAWEGLDDDAIAARGDGAALAAWEARLEWPTGAGWGGDPPMIRAGITAVLDEAATASGTTLAVTSNGILRLLRAVLEGPPRAGEGKVRTGAACVLQPPVGNAGWRIAAWDERP